jgi:hypothetical protein
MNDQENELFEAELRRLKPARLPMELQRQLEESPLAPTNAPHRERRLPMKRGPLTWPLWLRWAVPGAGAAVLGLLALLVLVVIPQTRQRGMTPEPSTWASGPALKVDQVEINRELLGSFDAVAEMPDGEPVRFRFQEWMEAVTLRDSVRGLEVVRYTPRIEIVPVNFASY